MIELELAAHYEALADPLAPDYEKLKTALHAAPLYHQWRTYRAGEADIVVNSYNTGTGKTKAALLRLLDLQHTGANVLFIAPTNELLRQHERDIQEFIDTNELNYLVLRLDAATIKELGQQHLGEKFLRQGDRLHQMLEDPRSVMVDSDGYYREGHGSYVLVLNPDIFYYALYGLGNPHDRRVLFRSFVQNFQYIVIDEFHYYNAKQLANFLFFLTLYREWNYFAQGYKVCLLTATPAEKVKSFLQNLRLTIDYIEPGNDPDDLVRIPALAPIKLQLWSAEALRNGLVDLAGEKKADVLKYLQEEKHGAFISSALWRINDLYRVYGGKENSDLGRLTGAEQPVWRARHQYAPLIMATPTVDIGYNFTRSGKKRQSIDFLFFDARSSDEFIQRLGRAGRVLGKEITNQESEVYAVVPDTLVQGLRQAPTGPDGKLERHTLNDLVHESLPPKNGIYAYINSGAIAEAFLPLHFVSKALSHDERQQAEQLYQAVAQVYGIKKQQSFALLTWNTRKYLKIKAMLPELLSDVRSKRFGPASVRVRTIDEQPDFPLHELDTIDEARARQIEQHLQQHRKLAKAEARRQEELSDYYVAEARFHFRDNFQPMPALAYDPEGFLATAEYTMYSALHIVQNYIADWYDASQSRYTEIVERAAQSGEQNYLCCEIRRPREQRVRLYFQVSNMPLTKKRWEERYCSTLVAAEGFKLRSDDGPLPAEITALFEQRFVTFYAVPAVGPEALALRGLSKITSLFTYELRVDFLDEGEHEYLCVVGTSALLVTYERSVLGAKYRVRKASTHGSHLFDWEAE